MIISSKKYTHILCQSATYKQMYETFSQLCDKQKAEIDNLKSDIENLKTLLLKEKKLNAYLKARFVECNTCTDEMKDKCLMFSEMLCDGSKCTELVDLEALLDKAADKGDVK